MWQDLVGSQKWCGEGVWACHARRNLEVSTIGVRPRLMVCFGWFVAGASRCGSQLGVLVCKLAVQRSIRMVCVYGWCGPSVVGLSANSNRWRWPHVRVARRRVSSGLCRRAPHPRRQSAWVSSGESLFGTSGANRSTKLAQLRGCDSAMARRGRGRGSGSSTQRFTFLTFLKGGKGGKQ